MVCPNSKQEAEDACATMQASLVTLQGATDATAPPPTQQQLAAMLQRLRLEAAKIGVMYNGTLPPTDTEAAGLLKSLQDGVVGVCMLLLGAAGARAGPTLRSSVHSTAERLEGTFMEMTHRVVGSGVRGDALLQLVGKCLEQCDAAAKMPLDNRTAIGRAITKVLHMLADASRELQEIAEEAEQSTEAAGLQGGGAGAAEEQRSSEGEGHVENREAGATAAGDASNGASAEGAGSCLDDLEDDLGACDALTNQQAGVVRSVHAMLGEVMALLKAVVRALLAAGDSLELLDAAEDSAAQRHPAAGVQEWEGLLFHLHALATSAEDLAAGIYPPQDAEELGSAAEAVLNGCELISEETPVDPASDVAEALHTALGGVEGAAKKLLQDLQAADGS